MCAAYCDRITPAVIVECRARLGAELIEIESRGRRSKTKRKRTSATVNRYLGTFSTALSTAAREWHWLSENPMTGGRVRRKAEPQGRVRFLSDDERGGLLEACRNSDNSLLFPIVMTALSTGMRLGELMAIRWPDVNLKRGWIVLEKIKNRERRGVPLKGAALVEIEDRPPRRLPGLSGPPGHGRVNRAAGLERLWP